MRHFKSRRGISSAIVGAMLLTGTTILGITLVAWSHSSVTTIESSLASSASSKSNAFNEYLTIENIWFCKGGGNPEPCHSRLGYPAINITIANYGNIGFNVTQIKFNDSSHLNTTKVAILPGNEYSWAQAYSWHSGSQQNIFITTARGSLFTTQVTPP